MTRKISSRLVLAVAIFALPRAVHAQHVDIYDSGGPVLPEQAAFDVTYYDLDIDVMPQTQTIQGSVLTVARAVEPLNRIVLDLDTTFTIEGITDGTTGASLDWSRDVGKIDIPLGRTYAAGQDVSVRVAYHGSPRVAPQAPWDGGFVWARTDDGSPWIATAVQGEGPDVWWPAKDHVSDKPDSVRINVTVPEGLVVATNGRPLATDTNPNGTRTYHNLVSTPISAYNVALNIAPYRVLHSTLHSVSGEDVPVTFYALPEDEQKAEAFLPEVVDHLEFMEEYLGPYPFRADGYKVAQTPHLGMEHQTVIAYGADYDNGSMTGGRDWGFDALHHHELSHEWWGNMVTNADWRDMWIHEGFGTYMQALYAEKLGGEDFYQAYLLNERQYLANRTPVAPRESRTSGQIYFDAGGDIYSKGAWVLHTLRWLIGDEEFFQAFRRMAYPDPAMEKVTTGEQVHFGSTDQFVEITEGISGMDLGWFFEMYVRQPELPMLRAQRTDTGVEFAWETPGDMPFPMPIEVVVDGRSVRVPMTDGRGEVAAAADAEVVVDPDNWVLRANQAAHTVPR